MDIRLAVACTLAASLAGGAAHAAPRKACLLLGAGTSVSVVYRTTAEPALTIRSADLASNRTHLTAVVRLGSVRDTAGPVPRGRVVKFHFTYGEQNYVIETALFDTAFYRQRFGTVSEPFDKRPPSGSGTGAGAGAGVQTFDFVTDGVKVVVDTQANELRMTIPLGHFRLTPSPRPKAGSRMTFLGVDLHRVYGVNRYAIDGYPDLAPAGFTEPAAYVAGNDKVSYVLGTPSCVTVGR